MTGLFWATTVPKVIEQEKRYQISTLSYFSLNSQIFFKFKLHGPNSLLLVVYNALILLVSVPNLFFIYGFWSLFFVQFYNFKLHTDTKYHASMKVTRFFLFYLQDIFQPVFFVDQKREREKQVS